jgi:hypothetical protein
MWKRKANFIIIFYFAVGVANFCSAGAVASFCFAAGMAG